MQKADIARHIQKRARISEKKAATVLDWILELLKTTLQAGESIAINGFGKFTVLSKRARQGRNPRTGEAIMITARRVVTFHRTESGSECCPGRSPEAVTHMREEGGPLKGRVVILTAC